MEVKDNREKAASHIKSLEISKAVPVNSDIKKFVRVLRKKKARTGVLSSRKQNGKNTPKHHGVQKYCLIFNKAGMPEIKYTSHISENCFGKRLNQQSIKDGLGGSLCNRADSVNHYKSSKQKWKRVIKALKNQNEVLFIMIKRSDSHRGLNNIKTKNSKKRIHSSSNRFINDLDYD